MTQPDPVRRTRSAWPAWLARSTTLAQGPVQDVDAFVQAWRLPDDPAMRELLRERLSARTTPGVTLAALVPAAVAVVGYALAAFAGSPHQRLAAVLALPLSVAVLIVVRVRAQVRHDRMLSRRLPAHVTRARRLTAVDVLGASTVRTQVALVAVSAGVPALCSIVNGAQAAVLWAVCGSVVGLAGVQALLVRAVVRSPTVARSEHELDADLALRRQRAGRVGILSFYAGIAPMFVVTPVAQDLPRTSLDLLLVGQLVSIGLWWWLLRLTGGLHSRTARAAPGPAIDGVGA